MLPRLSHEGAPSRSFLGPRRASASVFHPALLPKSPDLHDICRQRLTRRFSFCWVFFHSSLRHVHWNVVFLPFLHVGHLLLSSLHHVPSSQANLFAFLQKLRNIHFDPSDFCHTLQHLSCSFGIWIIVEALGKQRQGRRPIIRSALQ